MFAGAPRFFMLSTLRDPAFSALVGVAIAMPLGGRGKPIVE